MKRLIVAALLGSICARLAFANGGVLVDHVPGGATPEVVIAVCKAALTNRGWTVTAIAPSSIDAEIDHARTKAEVRLTFSDWRVLFDGDAVTTYVTGQPQGPSLRRKADVPKQWIAYLRRDISTALATIPETPR